jgi:flagellar export protein FliJ
LDERIVAAENHYSKMSQLVDEKRDIVERERIKKETLERLREKRKLDYSRMVERMEQKETDEVLTLRFQVR